MAKRALPLIIFALLAAVSAKLQQGDSAAWSRETRAFVRLNQIGYEASHAGRAYLVARAPAEGSKFSVNSVQGIANRERTRSPDLARCQGIERAITGRQESENE